MRDLKRSSTAAERLPAQSRCRDVVPVEGGWAVRAADRTGASGVYRTKNEAIAAARNAVSVEGGELRIHTEGRFRSTYTVGRGPFQKISAVEGIAPTKAANARAKQFEQTKLSSEERLQAIIEAHRPRKG